MMIKIEGLSMGFSEATAEEAAQRVAKQFGVVVEIVKDHAAGGWPEVDVIGTPEKVLAALTEEGGWATGSKEDDAEAVFHFFHSAKILFA